MNMNTSAAVQKRLIISACALGLVACDNLHRSIYNLTSCPVEVTYSTGAVKHYTVTLQPGEAAGSFGGFTARVDEISVKDSSGEVHSYSSEQLARLRPSIAEDRWVYTPTGLEFSRLVLPDRATPVEAPRPCK